MLVSANGSKKVAIVSRDPSIRLLAAHAFDSAPATWDVKLHDSPPPDADVVVVGADVNYTSGVRFDPDHPEQTVAAVAATSVPSGGGLTVVTSASGGTGVTSVALHLAACCSAVRPSPPRGDSGRGCFVDLDVFFGAARRLNLPDEHLTWRDAGNSAESLMLAALPMPGGFRALLSPADGVEPPDTHALLDRTTQAFPRVVADVPAGPLLDAALERCRNAVLVMRPDAVSAHRSKHFLGEHPTTRWAVVANRMGPGGEITLTALQKILGHPIALELPCAPALRDAADDGELVTSSLWRYRRAILRLRRALDRA